MAVNLGPARLFKPRTPTSVSTSSVEDAVLFETSPEMCYPGLRISSCRTRVTKPEGICFYGTSVRVGGVTGKPGHRRHVTFLVHHATDVILGVGPAQHSSLSQFSMWPHSLSEVKTGVSLSSAGKLSTGGSSWDSGREFGAGDRVQVVVDRTGSRSAVEFLVNGVAATEAVPLRFSEEAVFIVTLDASDDSVEIM
eukprot:RCo011761